MLKLSSALENHVHLKINETATVFSDVNTKIDIATALSDFDNMKTDNTPPPKNPYYCNPMPLNIAFGFLIYSWICVPVVIACQILHYRSVLAAKELHENLESKQEQIQEIDPFELKFKL